MSQGGFSGRSGEPGDVGTSGKTRNDTGASLRPIKQVDLSPGTSLI